MGDWTLPAFEGQLLRLPDHLTNGYLFRLGQYIGPYAGIYKGLIGLNLLFIGVTGGTSHSKRNKTMLVRGGQSEDVQILGSNCDPPSRWHFVINKKRPTLEDENWHFWPVTNGLYVPGVKAARTVASCLLSSNSAALVSAVRSQAHFGPGVISTGPGSTRAWVLEATPSKQGKNHAPHAPCSANFSAGTYVHGVLDHAYSGNPAIAFSRAVLYRLTKESKTESVIQEKTRFRLLNPYGLSPKATDALGEKFISEGLRQIEEHYRHLGWSALTVTSTKHLLVEDARRGVHKGQRIFSEFLHQREIARLVTAELHSQHK